MRNLAIFASGSGSNAENIIRYFRGNNNINVALVASNNPDSYVIKRAENNSIPNVLFTKEMLNNGKILEILLEYKIDYIVLAGFLLLIPQYLIDAFDGKIINIHPSLLPKFGGKGMYGDNVHRAVLENNETVTGITIHLVNKNFDSGDIIFQAQCVVNKKDNIANVAERVHQLEHSHYPRVIEEQIEKIFTSQP